MRVRFIIWGDANDCLMFVDNFMDCVTLGTNIVVPYSKHHATTSDAGKA